MPLTSLRFIAVALAVCAFVFADDAEAQRRRRRPRRPRTPTTAPATNPDPEDNTPEPTQTPAQTTPEPSTATTPSVPETPRSNPPPERVAPEPELPVRRNTALDVFLAGQSLSRFFQYNDDFFGRLRPYSLAISPGISLEIDWFPGAHAVPTGPATWFGLYAEGGYTFGISSMDRAGNTFGTTALRFGGGARIRIPIGPVELGAAVGYAHQRFTIESNNNTSGPIDPGVPDVEYHLLRAVLQARFALGDRVALLARGGYLHPFSSGEILTAPWFARGTVGGAEAGLGLSVRLWRGLELRLFFEARRYFYAFDPNPGEPNIAGGALDHQLNGSFGFAYRL